MNQEKIDHSSLTISVKDLQEKIKNQADMTLLDVRSSEEHIAYHIGGKLIPLPELSQRLNELDPKQFIVVYCRSGKRSLAAAELLRAAHFNCVSLEGGMIEWQRLATLSS